MVHTDWCNDVRLHPQKMHNYTFLCIYWIIYYQRSCMHHWNFVAGAIHTKTVFTVFHSVTVKLASPLDMFPLHCSSASCWTEVTVSGSDTCSHAHRASVNRCASAIEEHPAPTQTSILASSSVTSTTHVWTTGNVYTQTQAWMHAQVIKMLREWCSEILTAAFLQSETPPRTYAMYENIHFHLCVISAAKKRQTIVQRSTCVSSGDPGDALRSVGSVGFVARPWSALFWSGWGWAECVCTLSVGAFGVTEVSGLRVLLYEAAVFHPPAVLLPWCGASEYLRAECKFTTLVKTSGSQNTHVISFVNQNMIKCEAFFLTAHLFEFKWDIHWTTGEWLVVSYHQHLKAALC